MPIALIVALPIVTAAATPQSIVDELLAADRAFSIADRVDARSRRCVG